MKMIKLILIRLRILLLNIEISLKNFIVTHSKAYTRRVNNIKYSRERAEAYVAPGMEVILAAQKQLTDAFNEYDLAVSPKWVRKACKDKRSAPIDAAINYGRMCKMYPRAAAYVEYKSISLCADKDKARRANLACQAIADGVLLKKVKRIAEELS